MSGSRKLKFRAVPRAPRYSVHTTKHAEPVPLANRFRELIDQEGEAAPPPPPPPSASQGRAADHHGPTASMAQRLQDMLGESTPFGDSKSTAATGFPTRRVPEPLWHDEVEAVDSDTSDHEELTKSSAKVVVPMGQRLNQLLQEDSRQEKLKPRHKGKRPIPEPRSLSNSDDIEACDNSGTPTSPDDAARVRTPPAKPRTLPRIAEQFQEALMAAPSFAYPLPSVQVPVNQDYSTRLQRILQAEKLQHAEIVKGAPGGGGTPLDSLQVQVMKKSLEGRLITCKCEVIQAPSKWTPSSHVDQVQVIFNSKVAAELEIDVGRMVRINPPWRELTLLGTATRVILCTYFCEAVY